MAYGIYHRTLSLLADGKDPTKIQPSAWNDDHAVSLGWFDVKDPAFGAGGAGLTDDTAAIQAAVAAAEAVGGGIVYLPAGIYRCNSGLNVTASNVTIVGDGAGATLIYPYQTSGDFLYVHGTSVLQRVVLQDLTIYSQAEATSGALVHFDRVNRVKMDRVELAGYYGGLLLESVVHGHFSNLDLGSDANFTALRANSYLLKIVKHASGNRPSELHFSNVEARGQNGNNYLTAAIWIRDLDGAFFSNLHAGFCQYPLLVQPSDDSAQVSGLSLSNFFLDTAQYWGGLFIEPSGSYSGVSGAHVLTGGHVYNTGQGGIGVNCGLTAPIVIVGGDFQAIDTHGIQITKGDDVHIADCSMWDLNRDNAGCAGVRVETGVKRFTINGLTVRKASGTTPAAAVSVDTGCDDYAVSNVQAEGCTYTITDDSTTTDRLYGPCQSDLNMLTQNAGAGGQIDFPHGHEVFLLGNAYTVTSVSARSAFKGRTVELIAVGSVTVNHANNLKLTGGSNVTLAANERLSLTFNGTDWCGGKV